MSDKVNEPVELETKAEAAPPNEDGKVEAGEVATVEPTEEASRGGLDQPNGDTDAADVGASAPDRVRYASGLNEDGVRRVILDVDYMNRGRPGYGLAEERDRLNRLLAHPSVAAAKDRKELRTVSLRLILQELGEKSGHPRGR